MLDILLPSYIKSASKSVHQLYGTAEAQSYLEYLEELAHPGEVSGVLGGDDLNLHRHQQTSVHP